MNFAKNRLTQNPKILKSQKNSAIMRVFLVYFLKKANLKNFNLKKLLSAKKVKTCSL